MGCEIDEVCLFEILGQMSELECPHCGEGTSRYDSLCNGCGGVLGSDVEEPSLNFTDGPRPVLVGLYQVEVEESSNLLRLRQASAELAAGEIDAEEYAAVVEEVLGLVESALELYESPYMIARVASMEAGPAGVYADMAEAAAEMESGLARMLNFVQSENFADVEIGLKRVEAALWKVDAAQSVAIQEATALAVAA